MFSTHVERTMRATLAAAAVMASPGCGRVNYELREEDGGARLDGQADSGTPLGNLLRWSPTAAGVGDYATYRVVDIVDGQRIYDYPGEDILLRLPATTPWTAPNEGGLTIPNARNVVLIGGEIYMPASLPLEGARRRALYFKGVVGTVFVEGVRFGGPGCGDGITINASMARFYLQNIRVEIEAGYSQGDGVGASALQPWGGHSGLYLDKVTGLSTYQGLQIDEGLGPAGPARLSRTNVRNHPTGGATANFLMWLNAAMDPVFVDNGSLFIGPAPDRSAPALVNSVWPTSSTYATDSGGAFLTYPDFRNDTNELVVQNWSGTNLGIIREGPPPGGDYVPAGAVGTGYVSPGYVQ